MNEDQTRQVPAPKPEAAPDPHQTPKPQPQRGVRPSGVRRETR